MKKIGGFSLGSVHDTVLDLIDNVPSSISGARLLEMADRERQFIESYTNQSVGSVDISLKYQGVLVDLTIGELLSVMNTIGADVSQIRLGDFSESKGGQSNVMMTSQDFKMRALGKLNAIGTKISVYKALG